MTVDPVAIGSLLLSGVVLGTLLRYRAQTFDQFEKRDLRITKLEEANKDCERRYGELKGYVEGVKAATTDAVTAVVRESYRPKTGQHPLPTAEELEIELARYRATQGSDPEVERDTPSERPPRMPR